MSVVKKTLRESATEYLLQVPYAEKDRAKRIEGYTWNGALKCWVFRKAPRVYSAIVSEFGDELDDQTAQFEDSKEPIGDAKRPAADSVAIVPDTAASPFQTSIESSPKVVNYLHDDSAQVAALKSQLQEAVDANRGLVAECASLTLENERLQEQASNKDAESKVRLLEQELAFFENRNTEHLALEAKLGVQVKTLQAERDAAIEHAAKLKAAHDRMSSNVNHLEKLINENSRLMDTISHLPSDAALNQKLFRQAVLTADADPSFEQLIQNQHLDSRLVIAIAVGMEKALEKRVQSGHSYGDLNMLLRKVEAEGILQADQLDLAHLIRRQRNVVTHNALSQRSVTGRVLLILFAAALLWPALPRT